MNLTLLNPRCEDVKVVNIESTGTNSADQNCARHRMQQSGGHTSVIAAFFLIRRFP